jgi:hypothetical protein
MTGTYEISVHRPEITVHPHTGSEFIDGLPAPLGANPGVYALAIGGAPDAVLVGASGDLMGVVADMVRQIIGADSGTAPVTDRGLDLDRLIADLLATRAAHGNLPVVVYESKQDKLLGVDATCCHRADHQTACGVDTEYSTPGSEISHDGEAVYVLLDGAEGSRPQVTWNRPD